MKRRFETNNSDEDEDAETPEDEEEKHDESEEERRKKRRGRPRKPTLITSHDHNSSSSLTTKKKEGEGEERREQRKTKMMMRDPQTDSLGKDLEDTREEWNKLATMLSRIINNKSSSSSPPSSTTTRTTTRRVKQEKHEDEEEIPIEVQDIVNESLSRVAISLSRLDCLKKRRKSCDEHGDGGGSDGNKETTAMMEHQSTKSLAEAMENECNALFSLFGQAQFLSKIKS